MSDWNTNVIEEFRANGGAVASFGDQPLLLLTHRGAKTGTERTNPLAYFRDGEDYVVVASKGGAPTNPDWYHNLQANPDATVEVGTDSFPVTARVADEQERPPLPQRPRQGAVGPQQQQHVLTRLDRADVEQVTGR